MKNTIVLIMVVLLCMACSEDKQINIKPVSAFKTSELTVEEGQLVSFTDLSFDEDGQVTKWNWNFGNGRFRKNNLPQSNIPQRRIRCYFVGLG